MTRRLAALMLGLVALSASLAAQQRDARPPIPASGRIGGTVVNAESGRPVRFARVILEGPSDGAGEALTGDDGTFIFERLPPGAYQLVVMKTGYLDTAYGQTRPGTATPGKRIPLADREQIERLSIPISQGGSISGVVRDDRGDPAYRANVRVSRWVMRNGIRTLETVQAAATDERGRYRVALLPPRDYVVSVTPDEEAVFGPNRRAATQDFAPVFYSGAFSSRSASLVPLGLGEERADVDVVLPLVALGRVTGTVLGLDGRPVPGMMVALKDREHEDIEQRAETDPLGRFEFGGVVPGTYAVVAGAQHGGVSFRRLAGKIELDGAYSLLASAFNRYELKAKNLTFEIADAEPAVKGAPAGTATGEVTVASSNTSDVVLTIEPPRAVTGRIVTEGSSKPPSLRGAVVELTARSLSAEQFEAKVAEDGTFVIPNVAPGKYIVTFAGEAPPWNLASAMSNGADALDVLLEVPRDRDVRDLVLTMRDESSELSGTVTDAAGKPAVDRTAIVFPSDERLWMAGERRIKAMPLGADGKFVFEELRPGSYLLAMTESVEQDEWLNPDLLKKLLAAAVPVTIVEGEKRVQDLR